MRNKMANEDIDYWVSKVKWDGKRLDCIHAHKNNNNSVDSYIEMPRQDVISMMNQGYVFCSVFKNNDGNWNKGKCFITDGSIINNIDINLPLIQTKRKCFVSYYHKDDSKYKESFLNIMDDLTVSKSVKNGDISSDVSDEYVKQLIQKKYLYDTTVLVILIGPKTKCRKHVDWEISGALNFKVGESYAGLLGLKLPEHDDYGTRSTTHSKIPDRLADNFKSGYAIIRDYTTDSKKLQEYIELAYKNRKINVHKRVNSRPQMKVDSCS
nr:TIR domain-containing protein [Aliarcobacter cryaerophilus]